MPKFIHEKLIIYRKSRNLYMRNDKKMKVKEEYKLNKHPLLRRGRRTNDTIVSAVINIIYL